MAIKNLQFIVTVPVNVSDDWELPADFPTQIENEDINDELKSLVLGAKVDSIGSPTILFETITD